ncbi:MAG TPA: extracellular solute-binding protein [Rhodothermales bacterium]|nr:extracellular solute-binding protein [Rhodothermales bacterium]
MTSGRSGRRLAAFALVASLILGACGPASEDGRVRVRIWHQKSTPERLFLDEIVGRFNASQSEIFVETLFKENEEMRNLFVTAAVGGQGPELVFGPADNVGLFVLTGSIMPLERILSEEVFGDFTEDGLVMWRDSTWILGDQVGNHLTLVYNRALVPNPPETFDEFLNMADTLTADTDGDGRIDRYALTWNYTEPFFFIPFLTGFGGWVMDDDGNPTLDTDATVRAIQFILDLRDKHRVIPRESDYDVADALFKEGRAAMIINGPWSWEGYVAAGIDIGLTPIPKITETGNWSRPMVSAKGYSLNVNLTPDKYDSVRQVLLYLTSAEVQIEMAIRLATSPVHEKALTDPTIFSNRLVEDSMRQIALGRAMPLHPALRQIWDGARGPYQLVMNGAVSAEQGAKMMQEQAEKLIRDTFL